MNNKRLAIKNMLNVALSNITTIVAGVIIGFIIPKVLPVEGYGYYKTFTLYINYIGLFSFGIIDGVVLDYGGKDYASFDKAFFRSIFRWYLLVHVAWSSLFALLSCVFRDQDYSFIVIMIAVYMTFANIVGYFQQISQITQRFKEYSKAKAIQSTLKVIGGLIMMAIFFLSGELVNYRIYIGLTTIGTVLVAIGYVFIYKQIVFGEAKKLTETRKSVIHFSKIGFPLLIANLCSTLILSLDRQFVNVLFTNSEYAIYSFAYNMLSLVTVATSAISTVLYPMLKRTSSESLKNNYSFIISVFLILVSGSLLLFYPLYGFVEWFLPKYKDSLIIFKIIFPGLALSSSISVIMHNYYKTLEKNNVFFRITIIMLLLSAITNGLAYMIFGTTSSISIASVITIIIWYVISEQFFVKEYGYNRWNNLFYSIAIMVAFYGVSLINNVIVACSSFFGAFLMITFVFQRDVVKKLISRLQ